MRSTLIVTTPASVTELLTIEELRTAAGTTTNDAFLRGISAGVFDDIMSACNIVTGLGGVGPTLFTETLTETFYDWPWRSDLVLARRHNVAITSVTIDGAVTASGEYVVQAEHGILSKLAGYWSGSPIVVVYTAGFDAAPPALKQVALELFSSRYAESQRDDLVKSETIEIPGVETKRRDYWVGSVPGQSNDGPVPGVLVGRLKRFKNVERSIG